MSSQPSPIRIEDALDRIESTILPGIAITLDALLDAASVRPEGGAARAAKLRTIAMQLDEVVRQFERATSPAQAEPEWPFRMSA
jgi:hypothetical protein